MGPRVQAIGSFFAFALALTSQALASTTTAIPFDRSLYFERDPSGFVSRGHGFTLFLDANAASIDLAGALTTVTLRGARTDVQGEGLDPLPGKSNYFLGNDPTQWRVNVPHYSRVRFADVYPGIDVVYHTEKDRLEFDFVVHAAATISDIRLAVRGADGASVDANGDLRVKVEDDEILLSKPLVFQDVEGQRKKIRGRFELEPGPEPLVAFNVGRYDRNLPLVIDPQLVYSSYLGGTGSETARAIDLDSQGNIYVSGITASINFPTKNPLQAQNAGNSFDTFISKFSPDGSALLYSTYFGGSGVFDDIYAMDVDSAGNAYVAGSTNSSNFPLVNPLQPAYGGTTDAFVAKFSPNGAALLYSTYLGGDEGDQVFDIAVDSAGSACITGHTVSTNFPTMNPIQANHLGGWDDAFVAKLDPSGAALVFSTYLGGDGSDEGRGIALDGDDNIYITGDTRSATFPTTSDALQPIKGVDADLFVTKVAEDGQSLLYSTFLGGNDADESYGLKLIALDPAGNILIGGTAYSTDFPLMNPIQSVKAGEFDAVVAKIKADGSALVYSTYLGTAAYDDIFGITSDAWGNAHVVGETLGSTFPVLNAFQPTFGGTSDAIVAEISPTGTLIYASYLGGSSNERANDIVLDSNGDPYITGQVWSTNFPTVNPFQNRLKGPQDAFVAKITEAHPPLEVISLDWSLGDNVTLAWSAVAGADAYDLYRGTSADLPNLANADVESCLELQTPNLDSGPVLTEEPPAGTFYWYLVRGENSIGLGLLGSASNGPRILDPSGTCP